MSLNIESILDMVATHCFRLGVFERVNEHELKAITGNGLTVSIWVQSARPIGKRSGLNTTCLRVEHTVRIYQNTNYEPQDEIDPKMIKAADLLMSAYTADFELEGTVNFVDLLGAYGDGLGFDAGYVELSGALCRIIDICLPLICDDVWTQVA